MGVNKRAIKAMFPRDKWRIVRGDTVYLDAGKDQGQTGVVTKVIRDNKVPRAIVQGRNLAKRAIKRTRDSPGGVVSVEAPIHYSNLRLVDPVNGSPVRAAFRFLEDGTKVRVTRGKLASGSVISRPAILAQRRKPYPLPGPKDTSPVEAQAQTYVPQSYPEQWQIKLRSFPARPQHSPASGLRNYASHGAAWGHQPLRPAAGIASGMHRGMQNFSISPFGFAASASSI